MMRAIERLRRSVALMICPELGSVEVGSPATARSIPGGYVGHHNSATSSIRLEEFAAALPAGQRVVRNGLKDRLDLLLIAACAQAVRGLAVGVAVLQFVHKRALFGFDERVANGLGLKAVDATLFLIKFQNRCLHRYLLRLEPQQSIEQIRSQLLRRAGIDIGLIEQGLDVIGNLRRTLGDAHSAAAYSKDGRNGF